MEPSHCYEKCPCKWGNCIKMADGPTILKEADECCAANHQFKCCEVPDLFPDNMNAITESLQSKCIKTVPFFPHSCYGKCRTFGVDVYAKGKKMVTEDLYDYFECHSKKGEVEALLNELEDYFFFEHANCSRCGWTLCATFSYYNRPGTDFVCKCCDYERLVATQWVRSY
ncbi:hypothetical protein niasHT_021321 [Heterodera trifolii]|uniref:Uncharacterized protein n=1 Tax=Heterodera trifolii TaxID=157864 RepID=A0ABD2KG46_9BILA